MSVHQVLAGSEKTSFKDLKHTGLQRHGKERGLKEYIDREAGLTAGSNQRLFEGTNFI